MKRWSGQMVTVKTTGQEKTCVFSLPNSKANGTKLPSFIVFKGAKRETAALDREIKNLHSVIPKRLDEH